MEESTRSGAAAYTVQWPHFAACEFLDQVIVRRRKSNSISAISDSAEVIDFDTEEPQIETIEDVLMWEQNDGELTLHDVFTHRTTHCSSSDTSQHSYSQNKKTPTKDHQIDMSVPPTPSTSRTPSRSSMATGQSSSSHSSQDRININQRPLKKKRTNSDDTSNLTNCIAGAFDKFDDLIERSSRSEEVPLELTDEDYSFGRSIALSLKHIKSPELKLIVKSKIMTELAMAVNDEENY